MGKHSRPGFQAGDVVVAADGEVYTRRIGDRDDEYPWFNGGWGCDSLSDWFGADWSAASDPKPPLTLLVRDGKPVTE